MKIKIIIENFTISTKLSKSIQVKDLLRQIKSSKIINLNGDEFKLLDDSYKILDENEYIKVPEKLESKTSKSANNTPQNSFMINSSNNNTKTNFNNSNNLHNSNSISNNNCNSNINDTLHYFDKNEDYLRFYLVKYPKLKNQKYANPEEFWALSSMKPNTNGTNAAKKVEIENLIMKTTNAKTKIDTSKFKHYESSSTERLNLIDELINSSLGNIMGEIPNAPVRGNVNQGSQNVSQLLNILRPIIGNDMSEGEVIINRSDRGPGSIIISRSGGSRRAAPDENSVNSLKEMGFPEDQCRRALVMARNNISVATDLLLSGDMDYLPSENQHQQHANVGQSNNANNYNTSSNQDNQNNNNNNQANQVSDISHQDDEYMQNDYIEAESIEDEEMSDLPENIASSVNLQNIPNLEIYINNFINNNNNNNNQQQISDNSNSNSTNSNSNTNSNSSNNNNENSNPNRNHDSNQNN